MNNNDWLFIKILSEEKSITKAAKKLFITQPSLTEKIKKVEKELNIKLFVRQPHGIELTPAGEAIAQYAKKALNEYRTIREKVADMKEDEISGFIRIGCSNVFAKSRLPGLLIAFNKHYPQVQVTVKTGWSQNLYRDFLHGELQVAIIRDSHNWNQNMYLIWHEALCIISAVPLDMKNLPAQPYIHYNTEGPLQYIIDDWWHSHYERGPHLLCSIDAMDICLEMVRQGAGYTVLSESNDINYKGLYKYPLMINRKEAICKDTWMFTRKRQENIQPVNAFIDMALQLYPPLDMHSVD